MKILGTRKDVWSFGRDIVVIILGVLIALGFDSWMAQRGDRALEAQYLSRLERDLRGDSLALAEYLQSAQEGENAARKLLALLDDSRLTAPDTLMARHFSDATRDAYVTPNSPTIDELRSTGNLRVIVESTVRDAILTYYTQVTSFQRVIETVMRRGKDPLGEVGWDIRAFDPAVEYAALRGFRADSAVTPSTTSDSAYGGGSILGRFRLHTDAERATGRAITYNTMLAATLANWQRSLAPVLSQIDRASR